MKNFLIRFSFWFVVLCGIIACSTDDVIETKSLTFNFTIKADLEDMVFESKKYLTPFNQQITFERFSIYLSNVALRDLETNEVYKEVDSYHLISFDSENGTASFTIDQIPASYQISEIKMAIGVDAEANTSIDHVGDLDPTNGMAWDWNTGYKFFLMEGRYFAEEDPVGEEIKMHIGMDKNYFEKGWLLDAPIFMLQDRSIDFHVNGYVPIGTIDFSEGTVFMNDERGDEVAQNYKEGLLEVEETSRK
ncbi:MAG: MbnP family protein [Reichenbachiella sp.]|uniref:MbnP family protein n=1 Tax=Reichenbachiella sp. TaxID=2184521 RepID=UPI00329A0C15